jgi:hypothetical protein
MECATLTTPTLALVTHRYSPIARAGTNPPYAVGASRRSRAEMTSPPPLSPPFPIPVGSPPPHPASAVTQMKLSTPARNDIIHLVANAVEGRTLGVGGGESARSAALAGKGAPRNFSRQEVSVPQIKDAIAPRILAWLVALEVR